MAQTKDENKRVAIRDAMIADVVENGLGNAPLSRVATRAGVSAGTIYIYYANKEEMLQSIYLEVKSLLHTGMMAAQADCTSSADRIKAMWFAMFGFFLEKPMMFAFHEAIDAEQHLNPTQNETVSAMAKDINDAIVCAVGDGTIKPLPMATLIAMLLGPAVNLSRLGASSDDIGTLEAEATFDAIWAGIAT